MSVEERETLSLGLAQM